MEETCLKSILLVRGEVCFKLEKSPGSCQKYLLCEAPLILSYFLLALVAAQLVEQLLPTPEIRSSNPDIGKILSTNCVIEKTKIKKTRSGMAHL